VQVAEAQVTRAEALLQAARIRLGYTTIRAEWEGGDDQRIVAQRFAEQGDTISANTPLLSIIELDPIEAVIFATEREYALLAPGQPVTLTTDAYPDRTWTGDVARVSPIFREGSRQARVEISIENDDGALRPGMFVRVEAVLGQADDATIVPVQSLTERGGQTVVFVVGDDRATARMMPVTVGIRDGQRVQVTGEGIEGAVVTLGQQLLGEESAITLPDLNGDAPDPAPAATAATTAGGSEG
jgi:RND family efflux transporter MFP subunit